MEYALIVAYTFITIYLLISRKRQEIDLTEELERASAINDNLRQYIQELEQDLDKVCQSNQENEKFIELVRGSRIIRIIRDLNRSKPAATKVIMNADDYSELTSDCTNYKIGGCDKIPNRIYDLEIKVADVASIRLV